MFEKADINQLIAEEAAKPDGITLMDLVGNEYTDSTGVPLSSDRADAEFVHNIDFEYTGCPFSDSISRFPNGKPHKTPMSELERRRLSTHYGSILGLIGYVRSGFIEGTNKDPQKQLDVDDARKVLRGIFYLPHYLTKRAQNPVSPYGVMHPAIIIGSNAASGTMGAIEAYYELVKSKQNVSAFTPKPTPSQLVYAADHHPQTPLVGEKTVCVASPKQMEHFMTAVMDGPGEHYTFDSANWLSPEEIISLVAFGHHGFESKDNIEGMLSVDHKASTDLTKYLRKPRLHRHIPTTVSQFEKIGTGIVQSLASELLRINRALGRKVFDKRVTMDGLEADLKLKTPGIIRKISI